MYKLFFLFLKVIFPLLNPDPIRIRNTGCGSTLFQSDPDPIFNLNPDQDPGNQTNADPDPCQTLKLQKVQFLHEKYTLSKYGQKTCLRMYGTYAFLKERKSGLFVNFGQFQCSWIRIRIPNIQHGSGYRIAKSMRIYADPNPDPQHWLKSKGYRNLSTY
jgi:hypothetical protein